MAPKPQHSTTQPAAPAAAPPTTDAKPNGNGSAVRSTTDSLENLMTGMGSGRDSTTFARFRQFTVDLAQLEIAYRSDWMARKIVDIPAYDSTREWRDWQADAADITKIEAEEKKFVVKRRLMTAIIKARLFGGGALVLGIDQGKPEDPVNLDTLKAGCLKFVHAVSRMDLTAGPTQYDITDPYYGEPVYYDTRGGTTGAGANLQSSLPVRLHPSRVVRLVGYEHPSINTSDGWGDPVLQVVLDAITQSQSTTQSVADLVAQAKIDVISIPGLTKNISKPEYEARLKKRFGLAASAKSIYNMLLLDKEETWQRITTSFASLTDIVKVFLEIVSGAADIPATRFLSQSPRGLNATGISDIRNYYDRVASDQGSVLEPAIDRLDKVLVRSALGASPEAIFYKWNPLWQMDDTEKAIIWKSKADTYKIDVDAGLIDPIVMRQARENQLIEDGTYPGIETIIDDFVTQQEEMGVNPNKILTPEEEAAQAAEKMAASASAMQKAGVQPPPDPNAPPQPGVKKPTPPFGRPKLVASRDHADLVDRVRRHVIRDARFRDGKPRTLYVYRPIVNAADVVAWAETQGFTSVLPADEMHVTIAFSRLPVDWFKVGGGDAWGQDDSGRIKLPPGGMRVIEKFGDATVLCFASSSLCYRHEQIARDSGATWDWPEYQPHVTISYDGAPDNVADVEAYDGPLILGPECFEEVDEDYRNNLTEQTLGADGDVAEDQEYGLREAVGDIRTALTDAALRQTQTPPVINVPVTVVTPRRGKEITKVTKHDADGRIEEFERREVDEEDGE